MSLNKETVEELKKKLTEEKSRLEKELELIAKPTGTPGDYEAKFENIGSESDENATEVQAYTNTLALEKDLEKQLKATNDALGKMKNGTYGQCENCEGEIREERLEVYPAARSCMKCAK